MNVIELWVTHVPKSLFARLAALSLLSFAPDVSALLSWAAFCYVCVSVIVSLSSASSLLLLLLLPQAVNVKELLTSNANRAFF